MNVYQKFGQCAFCGKFTLDLAYQCCFKCATEGEKRAACRSVWGHFRTCMRHVMLRRWFYARCDAKWALMRLTRTGDYAKGGYFDQMGHPWRFPTNPTNDDSATSGTRDGLS